MEQAVHNAAKTLGLPEAVLWNFMSLVDSLQAPHPSELIDNRTVVGLSTGKTASQPINKLELLNSLVAEYDRKL